MTETSVRLDDVKRIEGHGRIALFLGEDGCVHDAHFEVVEFRGFERMLEGRMIWEMPLLTSRICGVCPVSHHLAAVKAADALLGTEIPPAARALRELMHVGALTQDHALHFFLLAGPDFLTGDGEGSRDILGIIGARPELALKAIELRKIGQRIVEIVGGRASHPVTAIPGGMSRGITIEQRDEMRAMARDGLPLALEAVEIAHDATVRLLEQNVGFARDPMPFVAQMGDGRALDFYDGIVIGMGVDATVVEEFPASEYSQHIGERVLAHSYAKAPYLLSMGPEAGSYRVGPLARLNLSEKMPGALSTELAQAFRAELGHPVHAVLAYHWARMIELVAGYERVLELLDDDSIVSPDVRVRVDRRGGRGVAAIEAPRGLLIHDYEADDVGRVISANLIVATTHNVPSLDNAVLEAVRGLEGEAATDEANVRRMELGIRAHDPCLSCATHEVGRMPFVIDLIDERGELLARRGSV